MQLYEELARCGMRIGKRCLRDVRRIWWDGRVADIDSNVVLYIQNTKCPNSSHTAKYRDLCHGLRVRTIVRNEDGLS